jgi:hypothetical protein
MMKKIILATFMTSLSLHSFADINVDLSDFQLWSATNGSDLIRVIPKGVPVMTPQINALAPACTDNDSYMVKTTIAPAAISRMYSTLLAAKMSAKTVTLVLSGCETNRPAIVSVELL